MEPYLTRMGRKKLDRKKEYQKVTIRKATYDELTSMREDLDCDLIELVATAVHVLNSLPREKRLKAIAEQHTRTILSTRV